MADPAPSSPESRGALLSVDRGNTTLDCLWTSGAASERARLEPTTAAFEAFLAGRIVDRAVGCSVVPGGLGPVREVLGDRLRVAGEDLPCPLEIDYPQPSTLGVDRWVAALAARERYGDAVVVDCGTAFTIDLVTADGRHRGGVIGAGLGTIARALATAAPALPMFDGELPGSLPALTSLDAVRAGVGVGFARMVEGLVEDCLAAVGMTAAARVLTGGDAMALRAFLVGGWVVESGLVHAGLRDLIRLSRSAD